jgi:biopolymer transport protein ExbB
LFSNALALTQVGAWFSLTDSPVLKLFNDGGFMMWPLLVFAIVTVALIIERFIALKKARIDAGEFTSQVRTVLLKNEDIKQAVKICENYRGPIAAIVKAGLLKYGRPKDEIEKTIENASLHEMAHLERGLAGLATLSNVAPITGFLGTVVGMINSFDTLAKEGLSNPGAVAIGIKVALITTAAGLVIAVPALLGYNWFTANIQRFVREMETSSNILLETFGEMQER